MHPLAHSTRAHVRSNYEIPSAQNKHRTQNVQIAEYTIRINVTRANAKWDHTPNVQVEPKVSFIAMLNEYQKILGGQKHAESFFLFIVYLISSGKFLLS